MPSLRGLGAKELPRKTENQYPEKWMESQEGLLLGDVESQDRHGEEPSGGLNAPELREPRTMRVKGKGTDARRGWAEESRGHIRVETALGRSPAQRAGG